MPPAYIARLFSEGQSSKLSPLFNRQTFYLSIHEESPAKAQRRKEGRKEVEQFFMMDALFASFFAPLRLCGNISFSSLRLKLNLYQFNA
jgi:hypothetical protein